MLWFPYNRDIQKIKQLPTNFLYILLINCHCNKNCIGSHHWITNSIEEEKNIYCLNNDPNKIHSYENSIFIRPQDLCLFDKYIDTYKL